MPEASGSNNAEGGQPAIVVALSSAVAGIVARLCTHPLDTIKARLQAAPGLSLSWPVGDSGGHGTIREVWRHSSWRSLYRGLSVALVGGTPGTVLYLTTYEQLKKGRDGDGDSGHTTSFTTHFLAGLTAEAVACSIYVPVDVVKERLQVGMYETPTMALLTIFRVNNAANNNDGPKQRSSTTPLRILYRGYWATLASFGPYSAFYFLFYEESKRLARETYYHQSQQQQQLSFWWILACSAGSGAVASFITSPLDLIKLRLQLQNSSNLSAAGRPPKGVGGTGIVREFNEVYRSAGFRGLFRGAGARVLHFVPATTIAMTTYETCLRIFSNNNHLPRG
jgi:hypothetical protein